MRQTLGKTKPNEQTLGKPLARREIDVSQTLGETLGSREAGVRLIEQFKTLVGNERELTEIVFFEAKKTGTPTTDAIKSDKLCSYFNMNSTTLRNLVDRVKKKNILTCTSTVGGHSSVRIFNLSPVVYHHLMQQTLGEPLVSREADVTQTLGLPSSKLVSKNNTNLLTSDRGEVELSDAMATSVPVLNVHEIQIENLAKFNITRKQIQDIKNQKLAFTTESLQDFIDRFFIYVSDSQNVRNIKSIPALFVKMAQLAAQGDDPLSGVETESDRLIRELLERKKQERERRLNLQEELLSFEFEDWLNQLEPEKQLALVPENAVARVGSGAHRMLLREYYKNHIWPDKFRELRV